MSQSNNNDKGLKLYTPEVCSRGKMSNISNSSKNWMEKAMKNKGCWGITQDLFAAVCFKDVIHPNNILYGREGFTFCGCVGDRVKPQEWAVSDIQVGKEQHRILHVMRVIVTRAWMKRFRLNAPSAHSMGKIVSILNLTNSRDECMQESLNCSESQIS